MKPTFYEMFCGGGLVRLGLGQGWICQFANDISPEKGAAYVQNFGPAEFRLGDVFELTAADLPGRADLWWASFPCQDLSLAGPGGGLAGSQSGAFWGFWRLVESAMYELGQPPPVIVLENVTGLLSSKGGQDFNALIDVLARAGYAVGALEINGSAFVPQSRPRLFIVAARRDMNIGPLSCPGPSQIGHTKRIINAWHDLPIYLKNRWVWWRMPAPPGRRQALADIIDDGAATWHDEKQTADLLALMSASHRQRIEAAAARPALTVATVYRRTRNGCQRAEVRDDGIAGCLRTGSGGSSKQIFVMAGNGAIRSRLPTVGELARLMGVDDRYHLPANYTQAYRLLGDGVIVPLVRWLSDNLLKPLVKGD